MQLALKEELMGHEEKSLNRFKFNNEASKYPWSLVGKEVVVDKKKVEEILPDFLVN